MTMRGDDRSADQGRADQGRADQGRADERQSLVGRLVAGGEPSHSGRPNPGALLAGVLALGAFVVSLSFDWVIGTLDVSDSLSGERQDTEIYTLHASVGSTEMLGLVYILGVVGLLVAVGAAIGRPDFAARARLPLLGGAGGLVGVVAAVTLRMDATDFAEQFGAASFLPVQFRDRITAELQPGLYFAYAAVLLAVVAVFLAAKPLTRTQVEGPIDTASSAEVAPEHAWVPIRPGGATDVTVSAAEPHDHGSGTDVWRAR